MENHLRSRPARVHDVHSSYSCGYWQPTSVTAYLDAVESAGHVPGTRENDDVENDGPSESHDGSVDQTASGSLSGSKNKNDVEETGHVDSVHSSGSGFDSVPRACDTVVDYDTVNHEQKRMSPVH